GQSCLDLQDSRSATLRASRLLDFHLLPEKTSLVEPEGVLRSTLHVSILCCDANSLGRLPGRTGTWPPSSRRIDRWEDGIDQIGNRKGVFVVARCSLQPACRSSGRWHSIG